MSSCGALSASVIPLPSIRFCCSTTFATIIPMTIVRGFRGTRTAASRPSPMCSPERSSTRTASATRARSLAGDVQWMTAGRGILHQEMPEGDSRGRMHGFQLWANLPSSLKMTTPRYQDVKAAEIPEVIDDDGTRVRVVCGDFWGKRGPVEGVAADPRYLDVWVPPGLRKTLPVETERHAFAYVFEGSGSFRSASQPLRCAHRKGDRWERCPDPRAHRQSLARSLRQWR